MPDVRVRMLAVVTVIVLLSAGAAACSAGDDRVNGDAPTVATHPAVTETEARAIFDRYVAANNEANTALDSAKLASIEGESSLAIDEAGYQTKRQQAGSAIPYKPIQFTDPTFYLPPILTYPRWFAVQAKTSRTTWSVFAQDSAQAPWLVVAGLATAARLPVLAVNADGAVAADLAAKGTLVAAPQEIAAAHARYQGTVPAGADGVGGLFTDAPTTIVFDDSGLQKSIVWLDKAAGALLPTKTLHRTSDSATFPIRALATKDGGVLMTYTLVTTTVLEYPGASTKLTAEAATMAGGTTEFFDKLTITTMVQYLVVVPAGGGEATVLGTLSERTKIA